MAKQIKAIKCPNCGSVSKTEIKTDYYKCNNCQTEYFLDDDAVNINYNKPNNGLDAKTLKVIAIGVGSILTIIFLSSIISSLFKSDPKPVYQAYERPKPVEEKESFSTSRYSSLPFLRGTTQQPVVMIAETRNYTPAKFQDKDGIYVSFYDPIEKTLLASTKILEKNQSGSDVKFRSFSDGNVYIIEKNKTLLMVDKEALKIEEVGAKFFNANKELQIGVAEIKFEQERRGDLLLILTNEGKEFYYYPLVQKLYTKAQYYKQYMGFNTLLPGAKTKVIHEFTDKSYDFPDEKLQLLEIIYKDNGYGPKELNKTISWGKDYGRAGIFKGTEPYKKNLLNDYQLTVHRVLKLRDLTPGRLYFSPSIKIDSDSLLVIQVRADANKASNFKIQKLDPKTGTVIWTADLPDGVVFEKMMAHKNGYIGIPNNEDLISLDKNGKILSTFKANENVVQNHSQNGH